MLQGLITALVTPMYEDGSLDFESLTNLIENQITNNASALVILGSTGEAATLNHNEKILVIKHAIKIIQGRIPLIIGVSQTATHEAVSWVKELNTISEIDYYLTLTPAYVKATQEGLYQHFSELAKASTKPIILYNVPGRTACDLADDTTLKLAHQFKNIIGLKDATGNIARASYLVKHKPENFALYSGDDATTLAFILVGGDGAISVTGNVKPQQMSEMIKQALIGNKKAAISMNNQIQELHHLLFSEANPIPVKWVLNHLGLISSPFLRLPLHSLSAKHHASLRAALNCLRPR